MSKPRIGVVGYGRFGRVVASRLARLGHDPHIIIDPNESARADASTEHPRADVRIGYPKAWRRLEACDLVLVNVPPGEARAHVLEMLAYTGARVRIEKPAPFTYRELDALDTIDTENVQIGTTAAHFAGWPRVAEVAKDTRHIHTHRSSAAPAHNVHPFLDLAVHDLVAVAWHLELPLETYTLNRVQTYRNTHTAYFNPVDPKHPSIVTTVAHTTNEPARTTSLLTPRGHYIYDEARQTLDQPVGQTLALPYSRQADDSDPLARELLAWIHNKTPRRLAYTLPLAASNLAAKAAGKDPNQCDYSPASHGTTSQTHGSQRQSQASQKQASTSSSQ